MKKSKQSKGKRVGKLAIDEKALGSEVRPRLLHPAALGVDDAEVVMGLRQVGLQLDCLPVVPFRAVGQSPPHVGQAEVEVRRRRVRRRGGGRSRSPPSRRSGPFPLSTLRSARDQP